MAATPPAPKTPKAPAEPKAPRTPTTHDRIVTGAGAVKQAVPSGGKPSTVRSTVAGAAGGAASGAALGSVVPGIGTAIGAAGGAAVGGAGGAVKAHYSKRDAKRLKRAALGPARQLLVAEFVLCLVILALSPLTDKHKAEGPTAFLRRGSAICALFFILALISSGGRGPTKVAAGFGGLVTLTLLVSSRDVFAVLATKFASTKDGPAGPDDTSAADGEAGAGGAAVGGAAGDAAGGLAGGTVGGAISALLGQLGVGS